MFPYRNETSVPKQINDPLTSIMIVSMRLKFPSFSASFVCDKNYFSTGTLVATLDGGFYGLSLITNINGAAMAVHRMFIPTSSSLSVLKTTAGSDGGSP